MTDAEFALELGQFIGNASMEGVDTDKIEKVAKQYFAEQQHIDDPINWLSQAVQLQYGFLKGIKDQLSDASQENLDDVLDEVAELDQLVNVEFGWIELTPIKEEDDNDGN